MLQLQGGGEIREQTRPLFVQYAFTALATARGQWATIYLSFFFMDFQSNWAESHISFLLVFWKTVTLNYCGSLMLQL